jgi:hypothetical protein
MDNNRWYLKKSTYEPVSWCIVNISEDRTYCWYLHRDNSLQSYAYYFESIDEAMLVLHRYAIANGTKDSFGEPNIFVKLQSSYWRIL